MTTQTLPESGRFTTRQFCERLGIGTETFQRAVKRYSVPLRGRFILAEEWWRAIATNTPKPPRTAVLFEVIDTDGQTLFGPVDRSTAKGYRDGRKELGRRCKLVRKTWTCSE